VQLELRHAPALRALRAHRLAVHAGRFERRVDAGPRLALILRIPRSRIVGIARGGRVTQEAQLELRHAPALHAHRLAVHAGRLRPRDLRVPRKRRTRERKKRKASSEHVVARRERLHAEVRRRKAQRARFILRLRRVPRRNISRTTLRQGLGDAKVDE